MALGFVHSFCALALLPVCLLCSCCMSICLLLLVEGMDSFVVGVPMHVIIIWGIEALGFVNLRWDMSM